MPKFLVTNEHQRSRRGIYNSRGKIEQLEPGETRELELSEDTAAWHIRNSQFIRVQASEEFVEQINDPDKSYPIPDNWASLPWNDRRALAARLSPDGTVKNGKHAAEIIEAELARRS